MIKLFYSLYVFTIKWEILELIQFDGGNVDGNSHKSALHSNYVFEVINIVCHQDCPLRALYC